MKYVTISNEKHPKGNRELVVDLCIGALLGVLAFLLIYGVKCLDVTNDQWILSGYCEWDIQQRYAGWVNYRNSSWKFPLGQAEMLAFPSLKGVNISFMDSMPLLCIFFKIFNGFLPTIFQFEGIYGLLIFILQGTSAIILLRNFELGRLYCIIGTVLFVFSPIMIERCFRHTSLASHYIILFTLILYFRHRKTKHLPWRVLLLSVLSVGITPYFLPMVMMFILLMAIENVYFARKLIKPVVFFTVNVLTALATSYFIGSVGNNYASSRDGYGIYSMNLNSLINPVSAESILWSKILKTRPLQYGQYDGFNYLGIGILLLISCVVICGIIHAMQKKSNLKIFFKKNIFLFIGSIFLTGFSVSNLVFFDNINILTIKLPPILLELCGIFRASSRIFYPVYYLLFISGIVGLSKLIALLKIYNVKVKYIISCCVLCFFVCIQIYDISNVIDLKHKEMELKTTNGVVIPTELLRLEKYDEVYTHEQWGARFVCVVAARNNLPTNANDTNTYSPDTDASAEHTLKITEELSQGLIRENIVYATRNKEIYDSWVKKFQNKSDFYTWNLRGPNTNIWEQSNVLFFMLPK